MFYIKVVKRSGIEEVWAADRTTHDSNTHTMSVYLENELRVTLDILSGDVIYVMGRHGETMSRYPKAAR